jgi:hypothetical protein
MIRITLAAVLGTLLATASGSVRGETTKPPVAIRLVAHLHQLWVQSETDRKYRIGLWIDLTNNTQSPIHVIQDETAQAQNAEDDYYIAVRRQDGKPAKFWHDAGPYTDKEIKRPDVYRLVTVNPGQKLSETGDAGMIYDMRQPGVYLIHVERKMPATLGGNFITSNEVAVEIPD